MKEALEVITRISNLVLCWSLTPKKKVSGIESNAFTVVVTSCWNESGAKSKARLKSFILKTLIY